MRHADPRQHRQFQRAAREVRIRNSSVLARAAERVVTRVPARAVAWAVLAAMAVCALSLGVPGPGAGAAGLAGAPRAVAGPAPITIFRVDVSEYPRIGLVVTVPGASRTLPARHFSV